MDFFSGCVGGVAGVVVGHPLDTVKVKLQTQNFQNPLYKGTWDCISKTVQKNGPQSLYRGMTSPMAGVSAVNATVFGVQATTCKLLKDPTSLKSEAFAGGIAGLVQSFICSPVELVKTRMQLQDASKGNKYVHKGPLDCMKQIYKAEGIRGVFRGQGATSCREVPAFAAYFFTFEYISRTLSPVFSKEGEKSKLAVFLAGGMAGVNSWMISYPIDVIKSRLQMDGIGGVTKYNGILDCLVKSVKTDGYGVLTRGLSTTLIRAFPTNAATFLVVDSMNTFAEKYKGKQQETAEQKVLEQMKQSSEEIIQATKEAIDTNNLIHDIKESNVNVNHSTSHILKKSEEFNTHLLINSVRNYGFYDSYCNKMSLFNSTQILGLGLI